MPVRCTIDHSQRLVEVLLDGQVGLEQANELFDKIEAANAVPYLKLIEATNAPAKIDEKVLAAVGARMMRNQSRAPVAVVVPPSGPLDGLARLFLLLVEVDNTRGRVFRNIDDARAWLKTQK
jgi:hypothetical protein